MRVFPLLVSSLLLGVGMLTGCSRSGDAPGGGATAPLVSARVFTGFREPPGAFSLSPDGRRLAWVEQGWLRRRLMVRDLDGDRVRNYRAAGNLRWTGDGRRLVFVADSDGRENTHVYVIDTDSDAEAVDLTPYPGVRASLQQIDAGDPGHILVAHNRRNPRLPDIYRIDLATRAEVMVARNPGDAVAAMTREDGSIVGWQRSREARRAETKAHAEAGKSPAPPDAREPTPNPPAAARPVDRGAEPTLRILGPAADTRLAWALSNRGRDRIALVSLHMGPGWEQVFHEDPDVDVQNVHVSARDRTPVFAVSHPGFPRITWFDTGFRDDLAPVMRSFGEGPVDVAVLSQDREDRRIVVSVRDSTRRETWLVRRGGRAEKLTDNVPEALARVLVPMQPIELRARDGTPLHGYLTRPRGAASGPGPMVLVVHGGPWFQSSWNDPLASEENARVQFLANRGYTVLQVNFRGSTGYGRRFTNAAMGEFAGRMQDDLDDALAWAVSGGIADPTRVAIVGHSYGGYAALTGLWRTPRAFACGVSIAGPTDLATLIEAFPPHWKTDLSTWHDFVGDPRDPAQRADMTRRSPLAHAAAIERPVLLIQGGRDIRVRPDQSRRMAEALARAGRPPHLVMIPEMGHGISWWAHQYRVLRELETFLGACLGGQATGFDPFDPLVAAWERVSRYTQ
jgi:dipeptidyl aminopeptidase/acylaminoacyl peptidase